MRWKLIFSLSGFGLVMGLASVLGLQEHIEGLLWLAYGLVCAVWLGRTVSVKPFLHGWLVGFLGAIASPIVQVILYPTYLANHPHAVEEFSQLAADVNPRWLIVMIAPLVATVCGLVTGLATSIVSRWVRRIAPEPMELPRRGIEWWVWCAVILTMMLIACFAVPYLNPGPVGRELWYLGLDGILWPLMSVILLAFGTVRSLRRQPLYAPWSVVGLVVLVAVSATPWFIQILPFFFVPYPSSHNDRPSTIEFRLPLDGPVTVMWGGGWPSINYHAVHPDQCWAYDLAVSHDGKTHRGDGTKAEDYYCFGLPLLAPCKGVVTSVEDGHPNMPIGQLGGTPAGGNQIVIQVAPGEFLFLCHLQPGSITVKFGEQVVAGQVVGRVGNSGNTSEPHLHIHLQDSRTDGEGEGIPLYFHRYRLEGQIVDRGIPTGGLSGYQIVEHVP